MGKAAARSRSQTRIPCRRARAGMNDATVIEVELLSGRYHAHLWGEAQFGMAGPEWPPSPWRLLRALASSWFCAQPRPSSEDDRDRLLEALGRCGPPEIWLPQSSAHELRYYQPVRFGASDRVLHHDHFAIPEGGRFWFRFGTALHSDQRTLLARLLERLRYFGRSESRARLRLVDRDEPPPGVRRVAPRGTVQQTSPTTYRRVLCTTDDFRATHLWSLGDGDGTGENGCPPHLVDALLGRKMPLPNGARWVEYAVPANLLVHEIRPRVSAPTPAQDVAVVEIRYRLSRRIPIPLRYMVAVARELRDAAVEAYRSTTNGAISPTLSGRGVDGTIARGHHHVYYLPRLRSGAVTLDEIVVRVPGGQLSRLELDALLSVGRIRAGGANYPITVVPEAVVTVAEPALPARRWRSITPFLPPLRHRRGREETSTEHQVITCVEEVCGRRPARVESFSGPGGLGCVSPILAHEYRTRGQHWMLTRRLGYWLDLTFDADVVLDRAVGGDAHFGAGQFTPVSDDALHGDSTER